MTAPQPLQTILVTKVYQLAEEGASLTNLDTKHIRTMTSQQPVDTCYLCSDSFKDSLHDDGHHTDHGWLEDGGISGTTLGHGGPGVGEGLGAGDEDIVNTR